MTEKIAYVVPTKDRPDALRVLFNSLKKQTRSPDQLIIVDGSDPDIKYVCDEYPELNITYVREFPPSLARQRNVGMANLADDITVAGYLDDDLELEPTATAEMYKFWESADDDVGGAAMALIGESSPGDRSLAYRFYVSLFMLSGTPPGNVLRSSFQCPIGSPEETIETRWLYGGATFWRREVIREYDYDEWFSGHGYGEDYEYSFRVGRKHRLFVVSESRTYHHHNPISKAMFYAWGRQQVYNRFYIVKKMRDSVSMPLVIWAMFGLLLKDVIIMVIKPSQPNWNRFRGGMRGLFEGLIGTQKSFTAYWKD